MRYTKMDKFLGSVAAIVAIGAYVAVGWLLAYHSKL